MNKKHYHVIWGFHGCIPENNWACLTKTEARNAMKEDVRNLRDGKNRLSGNLKDGYFEITHREDALCHYGEITECFESSCFDKNGELMNE